MSPDDSRRVLITGGASGLGAALATACRERGDRVVTADINGGDLHLDVRSQDDWDAAVAWVAENWGGLDVLINNAGVAGGGRVDVADLDEWQWMFEINVFGVARGTRAFAPMMKQQGSGQIINVASLAGLVHPAGMGSYNAAKAAVVAFTETTGHELAAYGITAHAVCPSYFQTNLIAGAQGRDTAVRDIIGALVHGSPWTADDIAAATLNAVDEGVELILPDPASRDAYALKTGDRSTYDVVMRKQAAKL
ncbi:MAG: SDR family NAD(P)-dependent oxidoreductase, partial [Myxococcales bacterium]